MQYGIVDIPRVAACKSTCAKCQLVPNGYIDGAAKTVARFGSIPNAGNSRPDATADRVRGGIDCHILQQASQTVSPIEGALRTTQHLDARQIARINVWERPSTTNLS